MSRYTTELRFICEFENGLTESQGYISTNDIIDKALPKIFDFDYPIFDENYRRVLEKKIIKHYYTREIGLETYGLWKLKLDTKLNEIMPYYNQLYESALLKIEPLKDVNLTKTITKSIDTKEDNENNITISDDNVKTFDKADTTTNTKTLTHEVNKTETETKDETETIDLTTTNDTVTESLATVKGSQVEDNATNENNTKNKILNTDNKDMYSDTPQGSLTNIESGTYLTNARVKVDATSEQDTTINALTKLVTNTTNDTTDIDSSVENDIKTDSTKVLDGSTKIVTTNTETDTSSISDLLEQTGTIKDSRDITNDETKAKVIATTESYIENITGKRGVTDYATMLKKFRETFLNIDMLVVDELNELFFNLW